MRFKTLLEVIVARTKMSFLTNLYAATKTIENQGPTTATSELNVTTPRFYNSTWETLPVGLSEGATSEQLSIRNIIAPPTQSKAAGVNLTQIHEKPINSTYTSAQLQRVYWNRHRHNLLTQFYWSGYLPTIYHNLHETDTFEKGNFPDSVRQDLANRQKVVQNPLVMNRFGKVPGLTHIVKYMILDFENYNPFHFTIPTGRPKLVQQQAMLRQFEGLDREMPDRLVTPTVRVPNERDTYYFNSKQIPYGSRIDFDLCKGLTPYNIAQFIIATEDFSHRKLTPVLLLGGMGAGKTESLVEVFRNWPGATKRAYSFQDKDQLYSRSEASCPCERIKSFSDIRPGQFDRKISTFPALILIDETQFSDALTFAQLYEDCKRYNCKIVMGGIPYDLNCQTWPGHKEIIGSKHRHLLRMHDECQICNEVKSELSAKIRSRPTKIFRDEMAPKEQWVSCCILCSLRYFPYYEVNDRKLEHQAEETTDDPMSFGI